MWRGVSRQPLRGTIKSCSGAVACGGQVLGEGRGCLVADCGVWPLGIEIVDPFFDRRAGVIQTLEQGLVQELVTHATVETLDEGVLHRLARLDVVPVDVALGTPGQDGV